MIDPPILRGLPTVRPKDILDVVPRLMIQPGIILRELVSSETGERCAPGALILTAAEKHPDYSAEALAAAICGGGSLVSGMGGYGKSRGTSATVVEREMAALGVKHRRDWNEIDACGFRRCVRGIVLIPVANAARRGQVSVNRQHLVVSRS